MAVIPLLLLLVLATCTYSQQVLRTFTASSPLWATAFNPANPTEFVTGSKGSTLQLWNKDTGQLFRDFVGHTNSITSVAFNPFNTSEILTGSYDSTLKLWHKETGTLIRNFTGHTDKVQSVAFNPTNASEVLSGSSDGTVKLWSKDTGAVILLLNLTGNSFASVAFNPSNGNEIIAGSFDNTVKLWNKTTGALIRNLGNAFGVSKVVFNPRNTSEVLAVSAEMKLWHLPTGTVIRSFTGHVEVVSDCAFNPTNASEILSASVDYTLKLWHRDTGALLADLTNHSSAVRAAAYNPSNTSEILSCSEDMTCKLWYVPRPWSVSNTTSVPFTGTPSRVPPFPPVPNPRTVSPTLRLPPAVPTPAPAPQASRSSKQQTIVIAAGVAAGVVGLTVCGVVVWKLGVCVATEAADAAVEETGAGKGADNENDEERLQPDQNASEEAEETELSALPAEESHDPGGDASDDLSEG
eukprot:TRINITY_DN5664_c1_g2_i7.p1 TRINITY_DN5664_c1_g2~~TRINITY_DN5664_c1_g2_i7.p1  ORF type:complete len:466 (+),score=89.31 TRINITY_DN5664_c1_g2_i7:103-1500(+)